MNLHVDYSCNYYYYYYIFFLFFAEKCITVVIKAVKIYIFHSLGKTVLINCRENQNSIFHLFSYA